MQVASRVAEEFNKTSDLRELGNIRKNIKFE